MMITVINQFSDCARILTWRGQNSRVRHLKLFQKYTKFYRGRFPSMGARRMVTTIRADYSIKVSEYVAVTSWVTMFEPNCKNTTRVWDTVRDNNLLNLVTFTAAHRSVNTFLLVIGFLEFQTLKTLDQLLAVELLELSEGHWGHTHTLKILFCWRVSREMLRGRSSESQYPWRSWGTREWGPHSRPWWIRGGCRAWCCCASSWTRRDRKEHYK